MTTYTHRSPSDDPATMLTEALLGWDEIDTRGMHEERFMMAYIAERPGELNLSPLPTLMPEAQKSPSSLFTAMSQLPPETLLALTPPEAERGRVTGLACFVHTWAVIGKGAEDAQAGRYTGKAQDHPDRVRLRMMAAHHRGHTVTLARAEGEELALPYPEDLYGPVVPALVKCAASLVAATQGAHP